MGCGEEAHSEEVEESVGEVLFQGPSMRKSKTKVGRGLAPVNSAAEHRRHNFGNTLSDRCH